MNPIIIASIGLAAWFACGALNVFILLKVEHLDPGDSGDASLLAGVAIFGPIALIPTLSYGIGWLVAHLAQRNRK